MSPQKLNPKTSSEDWHNEMNFLLTPGNGPSLKTSGHAVYDQAACKRQQLKPAFCLKV